MLETLENRKTKWVDYLGHVDVNENWKQKLSNEKALGITTQVYLFYPELFWSAFAAPEGDDTSGNNLDKLCIAGYLYFGSIILQDRLIDSSRVENYESILQISWMQEESLRILHSIFPPDSSFWDLWIARRNEYFESVQLQKRTSSLSLAQYEFLADAKAAFGKVAIDCCYTLFKDEITESIHDQLITSHTLFSIGAQLLDDIEDLDEDFKLKQINLALQWAKEQIQERNESYDVEDLGVLKKYVYVSGIYEKILDLAQDYMMRALREIKDIKGIEPWAGCILYKKKKVIQRKHVFAIYTKELYVKTHYATKTLSGSENVSAADCLERSLAFIFHHQDKAGSWTDMVTNAGFSNVWTTGFVLRNVSACNGYTAEKSKAVKYLQEKRVPGTLWGYSENWELADADSSTNVLIALLLNNALDESDIARWQDWFTEGEGFRTYLNTNILRKVLPEFKDFSGWTQTHDCVGALALNLLSLMSGPLAEAHYNNLKYILFDRQNKDNTWDGYWWTSPLYTTCYIVKALITRDGDAEKINVTRILGSIFQKANADGSFGTSYDPHSAFFTALVLDTVCNSAWTCHAYRKEANAMRQWLMNNQLTDGSFNASYILRIPAPHIKEPSVIENWSASATIPVDVVKNDIMRLYTTSMVCSAMIKCNKFLT